MPRVKQAAIYLRISRDRTGQEAGVDRQEHDCRKLAKDRGWNVAEVYRDNDLSAYSGKPRPGFDAMLAAVAAGTVDVVVAWHPDRLTRHPRELEDLIDALEAARCPVETVRAGAVDLTTRSGRTTARLVGAIARDESEAKAERLTAMHEAKARAGEWSGGRPPYGYRAHRGDLVVVPAEAAVIQEAARRVIAGESLHGVCSDLNAREVPTARGAAWRVPTLQRILTGPTVAGRRAYRGDDAGPATWPAILDASTWRKVRSVLDGRGRRRGALPRVSLLAGIVRCGCPGCGAALKTQRRSNGARVYVCPARSLGGCGGISIVADRVDDLVAEAVCEAFDTPALRPVVGNEPADPGDDLAGIEADLAALAGDFGSGMVTRAEWLAARGPLEARRDAARAQLATIGQQSALASYSGRPGALRDAWPTMTLDQRRAIVSGAIAVVNVAPATSRGPRFDPERIAVAWRV